MKRLTIRISSTSSLTTLPLAAGAKEVDVDGPGELVIWHLLLQ